MRMGIVRHRLVAVNACIFFVAFAAVVSYAPAGADAPDGYSSEDANAAFDVDFDDIASLGNITEVSTNS